MAAHLFSSIILLMVLIFSQIGMAQETSDSISVINAARGQYGYNNATINLKELLYLTQKNPEANAAIIRALKQRIGSTILGAIGGGLIGFTLGAAIGSGEPKWRLVGVGVGFVGIAAIFSGESKVNARRGVALHNAGLEDLNKPKSGPVRLGMTSTGLGISWRF